MAMALSKHWLDFLSLQCAQNATSNQQQLHVRDDKTTLAQRQVRNHTTCDNRLVVAKHPQLTIKGNTKRMERTTQINHMLDSLSICHELGTIRCSFDLTLSLTEPINDSLIDKLQDTTGRSPL